MKNTKMGKQKLFVTRLRSITLIILCIAMLTACAPNPTQDFVTSKNDGAFDSNIQETAPQQNGDETSFIRTGSFASTDGSVEYIWNIDQTIIDGPMPVVEAVPYFFTTEDARQIATVLFGDAVFYDIGPESERHYSRGELERKINLLSRYADEDTLYALVGPYVIHSDLQKLLRSYNWQLDELRQGIVQGISVAIIAGAVIAYAYAKHKEKYNGEKPFPWRKTILIFLLAGYLAVLGYATLSRLGGMGALLWQRKSQNTTK